MTKQEWIEYFEALNGRSPQPDEMAQALAQGEFTDSEPVSDGQAAPETLSTTAQEQPVTPTPPQDQAPVVDSATPSEVALSPDLAQEAAVEKQPSSANQATTPAEVAVPVAQAQVPANQVAQVQPVAPMSQAQNQVAQAQAPYQAMPNGMPAYMVPKRKKLTIKPLWLIIAGVVAVIILSIGGYAIWRNHSGKITGTWELKSTYDASDRDWHKVYSGEHHYLNVDKNKEVQLLGYDHSSYSSSLPNIPTEDSVLGTQFKVDQWNKKMTPTLTKSGYKSQLKSYFKNKFDYSSSSAEDLADSLSKDFEDVAKASVSYEVYDDTLTVTYRKSSGKLLKKERYRRISDSQASAAKKKVADAKSDYVDYIKKYNSYDDDDDYDYDDDY